MKRFHSLYRPQATHVCLCQSIRALVSLITATFGRNFRVHHLRQAHIAGKTNLVADALSRIVINAVHSFGQGIDFSAMAG